MNKTNKMILCFGLLLYLVGYAMLFWFNWYLGVSIFLLHWGINLEQFIKRKIVKADFEAKNDWRGI